MEVHTLITRGVAWMDASDPLLNTLQAYYQQKAPAKETLGGIFQRQNNGAGPGSNIVSPQRAYDSLKIYVEQLAPDRIVLVSQDPIVKGKNADFQNYGGKKGLAQYRFTLTTKGMSYESEN